MRVFRDQTTEAEPSIHAHYLYDAAGNRVRKVVRHNGGSYRTTVYIDRIFEHYVDRRSAGVENNTRTWSMAKPASPLSELARRSLAIKPPATQYQHGDHLDSGNLVADDRGAQVSREEFAPYEPRRSGRSSGHRAPVKRRGITVGKSARVRSMGLESVF
jgi:hypothetical protein